MITHNIINNEGSYSVGRVFTVAQDGDTLDLSTKDRNHRGIMLQTRSTNNTQVDITFLDGNTVRILLVQYSTARPFFSSYILPCRVKSVQSPGGSLNEFQVVLLN